MARFSRRLGCRSACLRQLAHISRAQNFTHLGFDSFIIYPLAIAKILGITAILVRKLDHLKEWAYVGFFFNFLLAFSAHLNVGDGQFGGALLALVLLLLSYYSDRHLDTRNKLNLNHQTV